MALNTQSVLNKGKKAINDLLEENKENGNKIETHKGELKTNANDILEEQKKYKPLPEKLNPLLKNKKKKESDIVETIRVLRRLENLAQDELVGSQRNSTVGNYNIVNNHNVSFIQLHTAANMKEDLNTLMHKTDATGKNLISALILMLSTDDGNFANQGKVKKILEVLDRLIKKNKQRKTEVIEEFQTMIKTQREIIENSRKSIEQTTASSIKIQGNVDVLRRTIDMNNREIQYLNQMKERKVKKLAFDKDICDKHIAVVAAHKKRYTTTQEKINELKEALV